jgi:hypothetical protein
VDIKEGRPVDGKRQVYNDDKEDYEAKQCTAQDFHDYVVGADGALRAGVEELERGLYGPQLAG